MTIRQAIQDVRQWDQNRPGFAGEHWLVLGAGLIALRQAQRSNSTLGRLVGRALGTALVARAASGRDGVVGMVGELAGRRAFLRR